MIRPDPPTPSTRPNRKSHAQARPESSRPNQAEYTLPDNLPQTTQPTQPTTQLHAQTTGTPIHYPPPGKRHYLWPVAVSICIALAAFAARGFHYDAWLQFQTTGDADLCRRELLDFLWLQEMSGQLPDHWRVSMPTDSGQLELRIRTTSPETVRPMLNNISEGFQSRLAQHNAETKQLFDVPEKLFAGVLKDLETQANNIRNKIDGLANQNSDPRASREKLRSTIADAFKTIHRLRIAEKDAKRRLTIASTTKPEQEVVIDPDDRQSAYNTRTDLQQDLKALNTQLFVSKNLLLAVWQNTSPHLDNLIAYAADLRRTLTPRALSEASPQFRNHAIVLDKQALLYQRRLDTFAKKWTQIFTTLRTSETDPREPDIFDIQEKLHKLVGDFAFHTEKLIEEMRIEVRLLDQDARDAARHHKASSQIKRAFHKVESGHRQFDFVASDLKRRNHFQLDASLRSAKGLYRRVMLATRAIDADLRAEAIKVAKARLNAKQLSAAENLESVRAQLDATVDRILRTHSDMEYSDETLEQYLKSMFDAESALKHLAEVERNLGDRATLLEKLQLHRQTSGKTCSVKVKEIGVGNVPKNLSGNLTLAAIAGTIAFIAMTFVTNRPRSTP